MDPVYVTMAVIAGVLMLICVIGMTRNWHRRSYSATTALFEERDAPLLQLTAVGWFLTLLTIAAVVAAIGGFWEWIQLPAMRRGRVIGFWLFVFLCCGICVFFAGYAVLNAFGIPVWRRQEPTAEKGEKPKPPRKLRIRLEDLPPESEQRRP